MDKKLSENSRENKKPNACAEGVSKADQPKVLALLREAQERDGYVTHQAVERISKQTGFTESEIDGVASFYAMLYLKPVGRFVVRVCASPSCVVNGGGSALEWAREILGVSEGGTTKDGLFTLEAVSCFGRCETAPNVIVNEENYGGMDSKEKIIELIEKLKREAKK